MLPVDRDAATDLFGVREHRRDFGGQIHHEDAQSDIVLQELAKV